MSDEQPTPPDDLKWKEKDDSQYVTDDLGSMKPLFHRLLAAWNIITGIAAIIVALNIWPAEPPKDETKNSIAKDSLSASQTIADSALQKSKADSTLKTVKGRNKQTEAKSEAKEMDLGIRLLILSLLFGVLGGSTHGLSSLMDFRGQRRLFRSWSLWYFGRPILGGMVSLVFYLVVRAGFFSGSASSLDANLYGIAAISTLVGMFTDQATNKLAELFKTMFVTKGEEREGKLTPDKPKTDDENNG
ncbi:MAG: hypothetical protein ACYC5R_06390 [Melioribacteraceae bacterium]